MNVPQSPVGELDVDSTETSEKPGTIYFRAAKKRKFVRRGREDGGDINWHTAADPNTSQDGQGGDGDGVPGDSKISDILRLRKVNRSRRLGVEFSSTKPTTTEPLGDWNALTMRDNKADELKPISDRFVGHTGQVVDVNQHMFVLLSHQPAPPSS